MELPKDYLYRLYRMPSIRYHDTAFVIYSKWLRSEDELAFPLVHKYVLTSKEEKKKKLSSSNSKPDHYMTDSECTYSTETRKRKDHDDNEKQSPNRQRRRTRSLEKCERLVDLVDVVDNGKQLECPRKNNGKLKKSQSSDKFETVSNGSNSSIESLKLTKIGDDQNNNNNAFGHETIKLEIVESQSNHSIKSNKSKVSIAIDSSRVENVQLNISEQELNRMQVDQKANCDVIAVDIHPRPISGLSLCLSEEKGKNEQDQSDEVLLITEPHEENIVQTNNDEDDIVEMRHLSIDGRNSRASDISDTRTIISEMSSSTRKIHTLSDSMSPSPIGRKRLGCGGISNSISSIATSSFSDDITSDQESTDEYGLAELRRMSERQPYRTPYGHQSLQKSNQNGTNDHIAIQKSQTFPAQPNHYPKSDKLRLHYVTQRILASVLPRRSSVVESLHNNNTDRPHTGKPGRIQDQHEEEVIAMLEQKHGKNYRLFDLESCISVITLERICELCKHIDVWLAAGQENVVVLQDREDRQRLGTAIAAYLEYMNICASNYQTKRNGVSNEDLRAQNTIARNWLDLDIFSMKKFLEDFIGPLRIPSHGRYIRYFSGLLSGQIKLNSSAIHLKYINIESPPSWLQYNGISSKSEWNSFIKIYEGLQCVYTSDIHIIPIATRQFLYQIGNLRLRGDILIRCYQIITADNHHHHHHHNYNRDTRELLFSLQFHTCAIKSNEVTFAKDDLDYACHDQRFPNECKVTFKFNAAGGPNENGFVFQSPLIRTVEPNELAKADSILNLNSGSSCHTQGPVDGSLYATILKSPKTPQFPNDFQPNYEAHLKAKSSKNPQTIVISPPPQFSNGDKSFEIIDRQPVSTSTPIRNSIAGGSILREYTQTPSRETSAPPRSDYSYVESRPATSQSNYRDSTNSNKPQQPSSSSHHNITVIETFHNSDNQRIPTGHQNQNHHQNGTRESVRSPLTLSMDSGISSSGLLIRPQQRSSVSPSSFPSQSSPQEDRDRELDDILSDMLMTVQDIPDYRNGSSSSNNNIIKSNSHNHNSTTATQKIVRSQSVIPTTATTFGQQQQHHQHHLQQQHHQHHHSTYTLPTHHNNYNRDILKRSQSYISHENVGLLPSANNNLSPYLSKDRDPYDTASTTTTLTPPPSESGRDTPIQISGSNISTLQHQRHRRDTSNSMASQSQHSGSNNHLVSSQHHNHQSSIYPQSVRSQVTDTIAISEDEDHNIPYHAREHSQPFTYGNVPNGHQLNEIQDSVVIVEQDPRMIKAQSGLTSPMLVRKTFGSSSGVSGGGVNNYNNINSQTILRKTPTRNDFEDMLRDRREKVMSEKYSIGDKQLSATNGYHYYNEPLKRSNTLDGFRRNTTTTITTTNINDENSGQSWLQLQQQKLRAKKDQLRQDERKYYEEIHTEMRNRPHRAKRNVHYDGYASDTAAFADEVDYRRPLHVQTPYNASRSPERNYHTLTKTTTTTVSKERPFVAVKRAHEFAKNEKIGSPSSSLQPLTILKESPNGHIVQAQSNNNNISNNISNNNNSNKQNGLLSMAEQTPTRNGQTRLESEKVTNFQADKITNSIACTNLVNNINNNNTCSNQNASTIRNNENNQNDSNNYINNNNNHTIIHKSSSLIVDDITLTNTILNPSSSSIENVGTITSTSTSANPNAINENHCTSSSNGIDNNNLNQNHNNSHYHNQYQNSNPHHHHQHQNQSQQIGNNKINNNNNNNSVEDNSKMGINGILRKKPQNFNDSPPPVVLKSSGSTSSGGSSNGKISSSSSGGVVINGGNQEPTVIGLDRLLASLANEAKLINQQISLATTTPLTTINNNKNQKQNQNQNTDLILEENHENGASSLSPKANQELSDVIADLTEFTRYENMRQINYSNNNQNNNNNNGYSDNISNNSGSSNNSPLTNGHGLGLISRRIISESDNSSSISPSLSERSSNMVLWNDQMREESFSSYRSETEPELSIAGSPRPETPAFPVTPRTPYGFGNGNVSPALPPKSPNSQRRLYNSAWSLRSQLSTTSTLDTSKDLFTGAQSRNIHEVINQNDTIANYTTRRNSNASSEPQEVAPHHVKFVRDSSKYWYKPSISREEAIALLRNASPGSFVVRDSTTYNNAYGLVVRVAQPPPGVTMKPGGDELVRHFLIEPTTRGVRLKGSANEPVFSSLSALVYQHSITQLALPCRLVIPDRDIQMVDQHTPAQKQLLSQGAACNVLYLYACDTESLTGEEAVRRAVNQLYSSVPLPQPIEVHFKVAKQGITLTDNSRKKFFRKHYAANIISFCGLDPENRLWSVRSATGDVPINKNVFAFVARRSATSTDNQCHIFCDLTPNQPATAIVSFANKILPTEKHVNYNI